MNPNVLKTDRNIHKSIGTKALAFFKLQLCTYLLMCITFAIFIEVLLRKMQLRSFTVNANHFLHDNNHRTLTHFKKRVHLFGPHLRTIGISPSVTAPLSQPLLTFVSAMAVTRGKISPMAVTKAICLEFGFYYSHN